MKGIIFNLLEDMVAGEGGDSAWDELLVEADLDGGYSAIGNYPDQQLLTLVAARARAAGIDPDEVTRAFGSHALAGLAARYPQFFEPYTQTLPFLLTLNDVIHPEVRKLHADSDPPVFEFDDSVPGRLVIGYSSRRGLCVFAEGMISGAAAHYGDRMTITQPQCMHRGADSCLIECVVESGGASGGHHPDD